MCAKQATSFAPSGGAKIASNSCKTNTFCIFDEAKASASNALLSNAKIASSSEAKPHG